MAQNKEKGISLAKGPVAIVGIALLAYGITGLLFGGHDFAQHAISGTQNGKQWLGLEANGWSNLLFAGSGALLLFGSPLHWGAKSVSLIVGLVLGSASVIALVDGDDVFGIFAANALTNLVWGIAAAVLLILALLPRVGGTKQNHDDARAERNRSGRRVPRRPRTVEREPRFERERATARDSSGAANRAPSPMRRETLETAARRCAVSAPDAAAPARRSARYIANAACLVERSGVVKLSRAAGRLGRWRTAVPRRTP